MQQKGSLQELGTHCQSQVPKVQLKVANSKFIYYDLLIYLEVKLTADQPYALLQKHRVDGIDQFDGRH